MPSYVYCGHVAAILFMQLIICTMTVVEGGHPPLARRKVAVEGSIYCHDCAPDPNKNNQLILIESSIAAAVLKLQCNNTRKMWEEQMTTDHNGELLIKTNRVTSWGAHRCQLFFVSSPRLNCSATVFPFEETYGHPLIPVTTASSSPFQLYKTLPFVFYPHSYSCV